MKAASIIMIVLTSLVVVALIVFMIWKNRKDKKLLNPDAQDAVEETHMDQERQADKT